MMPVERDMTGVCLLVGFRRIRAGLLEQHSARAIDAQEIRCFVAAVWPVQLADNSPIPLQVSNSQIP